MNPLTTIQPKKSAPLFAQRIAESKQRAAANYKPTIEECQEIVYAIFRAKLLESMPKAMRTIYRDFNALMVSATPKAEVVIKKVSEIKVDKTDVERAFGPDMWNSFSKETQSRYAKAIRLETDERKQELIYYRGVFKAQQKISVEIDDDMYMAFEELGESVTNCALDRIDTHILPDFARNPANLMKPSEIVPYLIIKSKGHIAHLDKMNIGRELEKLGYEKKAGRYYVQLVR